MVWRVEDSAQALFDVDDYQAFVNIQVDTGLRDLASHYAYDHGEEHELTLRADAEEVAARLREELSGRVKVAGVVVDEARLLVGADASHRLEWHLARRAGRPWRRFHR